MNLVCAVGFLKNTLLGVAHKHYYLSNCIMCKAVYIVENAGGYSAYFMLAVTFTIMACLRYEVILMMIASTVGY